MIPVFRDSEGGHRTNAVILASLLGCLMVTPVIVAVSSQTVSADSTDDALNAGKEFLDDMAKLRDLDATEERDLVATICAAEEDERKQVSVDVTKRVADLLNDAYALGQKHYDVVTSGLKDVNSHDDRKSDADSLLEEITTKWAKIDPETRRLVGANHPVVRYMLDKGNELHKKRGEECMVANFETGNGPADCIGYGGNPCLIVEFKPDNPNAISKGRGQLNRYQSGLANNPDRMKKLIDENSDFITCGAKFDTRIDCYKHCPDFDDNGMYIERNETWREGC